MEKKVVRVKMLLWQINDLTTLWISQTCTWTIH